LFGLVVHRHREFESIRRRSQQVHGVDVHPGVGETSGHGCYRAGPVREHGRDHAAFLEEQSVMFEHAPRGRFVVDDEFDGPGFGDPDRGKGLDVDSDGGELLSQIGERTRSVLKMDRKFGHERTIRHFAHWWAVLSLVVAACSGPPAPPVAQCADVVAVSVDRADDGTVSFAVTIRSDETGWDGYADRWEVLEGGELIGERILAHPHVDEQPFTRSQSGITVTGDRVLIRAHHSVGGFCGSEMTVAVE